MSASTKRRLGEQPSALPPTNLGDLFTGHSASGDRAEVLTPVLESLRSPRDAAQEGDKPAATVHGARRYGPSSATAASVRSTTPRLAKQSRADGQARTITRRPPKGQVADAGPARVVAVYLPASLASRLREHADETQQPLGEVIVCALESQAQRLTGLLSDTRPTVPGGILFGPRRARSKRTAEGRVQVGVRMTDADIAVIDSLVVAHQAPSRNELLLRALDAHLPVAR